MVGVPKCLGASCTAGLSYSSVLSDDSGYYYCYRWNSSGILGEGTYENCRSGNIYAGYGYWIWGRYSNYYRLDEPSGVGNVTASPFDITLDPQGGYNMISNPYNKRIPLQGTSGPRVNVVRVSVDANCNETGVIEEVDYDTAVKSVASGGKDWIGSSIYEWEGQVSGYVGRAYNDTTPAVLEPWTGYWIYLKRGCVPSTDALKLRVYRE
jgi:hypothetical protein